VDRLRQTPTNKRRLFRGQHTDEPLLPSIVRLAIEKGFTPAKINDIEKQMLERFRPESVPMLNVAKELTNWDLLSIAQHHGMPTRLLDWTANALAGLWFAVTTDPPDNEKYGVVWVLDGPNEKEFNPNDDIFDLRKTYFFQPFHLDRRISAQSAWFSIFRHNRTDFLSLERQPKYNKALKRIIVYREQFGSLRQELRQLGISYASMYPDLEGLSKDVREGIVHS